jgi:Complex1_LYR-like
MPPTKIPGPVAAKGLYRKLLRSHQKYLPPDMKEMGDGYVKSEFKLHRKVTRPETLDLFYTEWVRYLNQLESAARARAAASVGNGPSNPFQFGSDLPQDLELTEEQKAQLEKLKEAARKLW